MAEVGGEWVEWQMEVPRETDPDAGGVKPPPLWYDESGPYINGELPCQTSSSSPAFADNLLQFPTVEEAQVASEYPTLSATFFGLEAFSDSMSSRLLPAVHRFWGRVMVNVFTRLRKSYASEMRKKERLQKSINDQWACKCSQIILLGQGSGRDLVFEKQQDLTPPVIRQWIREVETLIAILKKFTDPESVTELCTHRTELEDMLAAMGLKKDGRDATSK
jgi:hypothetical protein